MNTNEDKKKSPGRPRKYATVEEYKEAKKESNRRTNSENGYKHQRDAYYRRVGKNKDIQNTVKPISSYICV